jgi:sulfonate transport system ATP-binding protein
MTALHNIRQGIPLAIEKIEKSFGERQVLKGIDLHIPAGQFVAVVGRSGCGKSTLLRLLAGLDQPSGGQLLAGTGSLNAVREDIRLMFQDSRLLPWKRVIDNVGQLAEHRVEQDRQYHHVGLQEFAGVHRQVTGANRPRKRWRRWAWPIAPMNGRQRCPADRSSAWPWPVR